MKYLFIFSQSKIWKILGEKFIPALKKKKKLLES